MFAMIVFLLESVVHHITVKVTGLKNVVPVLFVRAYGPPCPLSSPAPLWSVPRRQPPAEKLLDADEEEEKSAN
ncbi:MAG: hypothetical protein LIQ31_05025, partial [Planctomycetes bacterium]|nr:hypothetical protein [Planctomycetota bacterium]